MNNKPQLGKKITFDQVVERINHYHSDFPGSHWYAIEKAKQYSDSKWYEATISSDLVKSLTIHEPHQHDSGRTILISEGETIQQAADNYRALETGNGIADKECYQKIETIRLIIKSGQQLDPLVLAYDVANDSLAHIDGLHRIIAWVVQSPEKDLKALVAYKDNYVIQPQPA